MLYTPLKIRAIPDFSPLNLGISLHNGSKMGGETAKKAPSEPE
jgi:hypothetical protein